MWFCIKSKAFQSYNYISIINWSTSDGSKIPDILVHHRVHRTNSPGQDLIRHLHIREVRSNPSFFFKYSTAYSHEGVAIIILWVIHIPLPGIHHQL